MNRLFTGFAARLTGARVKARTETVFQLEAAECGAASLAMVLAYFGRRVTLESLRTDCGVSRDGSKASSLLRAARSYGLTAKGLKAEPEHLSELTPPMIAFVNFNHFLVVEAVAKDSVVLNDPAVGHRTVSKDEFDAMFTGVVLTFSPTENFVKGDFRPSIWTSLFARAKGFRLATLFVFIASLSLVVPGILIPIFSRVFVDQILVQELDSWLWPLLTGMTLTALVRYVLTLLQTLHLTRAEIQLAIKGSIELFARTLQLPIDFFGARYTGEIADRLRLNDRLAALLTGDIARASLSLVTASFFLAIMCLYSWRVAVAVGVLNLANLLALRMSSRRLAERHQKAEVERGRLIGVGVSGLQDIETFKAAGYEDSFFARWSGLHTVVLNAEQQIGATALFAAAFPVWVASLSTAIVLGLGGLEVMQGHLTVGSLVALQSLAVSFAGPVAALTQFGLNIQDVKSHTERIDDIMHHPLHEPSERNTDAVSDRLPTGRIELRQLAFGYQPLEPPFIDGFDLTVSAGASVALVGGSGSGKSTLGRLIAGLIHPTSGTILLDGIPLSRWEPGVLAASRAHVDQEIVLFEGSVRDNLTLWDTTTGEAEIVRAAQDALIHNVIASRAGGYESLIAEDGHNFSGGQRQRLEIARALVSDPRILILDEATSALDPVTESGVMENLKKRGCTLIIIAHRLSSIRDCDEIIVMDRGIPLERGTHEELVALGGSYARLIEE